MASKFRLNRYNWFGQKLLAQHEYGEIIRLSQYLACPDASENHPAIRRQTSDHFSYLHGLALMKTSTHLDEIIFALQRLNFDKNNQYFLLLCNCLLYSGNYDSVVALCKQVISKEIDAIGAGDGGNGSGGQKRDLLVGEDELLVDLAEGGDQTAADGPPRNARNHKSGQLNMMLQESFEFKRIFDNINGNHLINEPRLWFTFGLCLEYQRQLRDAHFAFRVAAKLTSGDGLMVEGVKAKQLAPKDHLMADQMLIGSDTSDTGGQVSMSNYHAPHEKFAEFCIRHKGDFRSAIQILSQGRRLCPHNYGLNSMLALCLSGQPNGNQANFDSAMEILSSLEAHSITNRNPSSGYNRMAIKCMQKLRWSQSSHPVVHHLQAGNEDQQNLDYLLAKAYVVINSLVQSSGGDHKSGDSINGFGSPNNRLDKLIEALRNSGPACRVSASLWNNLGLCYLIKRRFIACFSCLSKANQLSPLDWRINYNLAAVCVHVGLFGKAMMCLLAAKSLYAASQLSSNSITTTAKTNKTIVQHSHYHPLITSLLAICYERLEQIDESRRLHIESIRPGKRGGTASSCQMPIIALINYLIFLHKKNPGHSDDEQHVKLKLHLLDQLEHCWLQRSQNDPQFSCHILEIACLIGEETLANQNQATKKSYAWTKSINEPPVL